MSAVKREQYKLLIVSSILSAFLLIMLSVSQSFRRSQGPAISKYLPYPANEKPFLFDERWSLFLSHNAEMLGLSVLIALLAGMSFALHTTRKPEFSIPFIGSVRHEVLYLVFPIVNLTIWLRWGHLFHMMIENRISMWLAASACDDPVTVSQIQAIFRDGFLGDLWFQVFYPKYILTAGSGAVVSISNHMIMVGYAGFLSALHAPMLLLPLKSKLMCTDARKLVVGLVATLGILIFASHAQFIIAGPHATWFNAACCLTLALWVYIYRLTDR